MSKRIGILTSGGDCAGLNAVLRAAAHRAIDHYGWKIFGIKQGVMGFLRRPVDVQELDLKFFSGQYLRAAGTVLGTTNKGNPFKFPMQDGSFTDKTDDVIEGYKSLGLDALIGVGGDGSLRILRDLAQKGDINFVGIPKTIDNDLGSTETSIGYDTAVSVATEALDRLQPTAASHNRVMILEVMGRDAGHIALSSGIAGGADVILLPEIPYQFDIIAQKIEQVKEHGRNFALIVVAEAVKDENGDPIYMKHDNGVYGGIGEYVGQKVTEMTGAETRVTRLGHVQRGGMPTANDRVLASALGVHAVDLIHQEKFDHMVAWQNRSVISVPLMEAIADNRLVNVKGTLVSTARGLGICLGDEV